MPKYGLANFYEGEMSATFILSRTKKDYIFKDIYMMRVVNKNGTQFALIL
jgi:hypothetical protein